MFSLLARAKVDFHFDSPGQPNQSPLFIILIFIWMMVLDLLIIYMELELLFLCYCSLCVRTKYSMIIWEFTLRIIRFAEQHKISRIESLECYIHKQQQPQRLSRMLAPRHILQTSEPNVCVCHRQSFFVSSRNLFISAHFLCAGGTAHTKMVSVIINILLGCFLHAALWPYNHFGSSCRQASFFWIIFILLLQRQPGEQQQQNRSIGATTL